MNTHAPSATLPAEFDLASYDFELPIELIAQEPAQRRDASRLLVVDRVTGELTHAGTSSIVDRLRGDEAIVVNETRVVPARLVARKPTGGRVELLTLPPDPELPPDERWAMFRCSGHLRPGMELFLGDRAPAGVPVAVLAVAEGRVHVRFPGLADEVLEIHGQIPLPPYIARPGGTTTADRERYQTVYANAAESGSVAAPTAGLHFTDDLLGQLQAKDIPVIRIALHVGPGTFQPVRVDDLRQHAVEPEWSHLSEDAADALRTARRDGRRILAVGTTSVRTLEGNLAAFGELRPGRWRNGTTIRPGHEFRVVHAMLTNFHLPRSSLFVLIACFGGLAVIQNAYSEAVQAGYRFYSYGDAMLIA